MQGIDQGRRYMLAVETDRASAVAIDFCEFVATVFQGNIDRIGRRLRSPDAGAHVGEIVADIKGRNASLSLVSAALGPGRTAKEIDDVVLFQDVRKHVSLSTT